MIFCSANFHTSVDSTTSKNGMRMNDSPRVREKEYELSIAERFFLFLAAGNFLSYFKTKEIFYIFVIHFRVAWNSWAVHLRLIIDDKNIYWTAIHNNLSMFEGVKLLDTENLEINKVFFQSMLCVTA